MRVFIAIDVPAKSESVSPRFRRQVRPATSVRDGSRPSLFT